MRNSASGWVVWPRTGTFLICCFTGRLVPGKKTRVQCLLKALYGAGAEKQRLEHREFKTPTNKTIEVTTVASNYHIEMNP